MVVCSGGYKDAHGFLTDTWLYTHSDRQVRRWPDLDIDFSYGSMVNLGGRLFLTRSTGAWELEETAPMTFAWKPANSLMVEGRWAGAHSLCVL